MVDIESQNDAPPVNISPPPLLSLSLTLTFLPFLSLSLPSFSIPFQAHKCIPSYEFVHIHCSYNTLEAYHFLFHTAQHSTASTPTQPRPRPTATALSCTPAASLNSLLASASQPTCSQLLLYSHHANPTTIIYVCSSQGKGRHLLVHVSGSAFCWDLQVCLSRHWDGCPLGLGLVVEDEFHAYMSYSIYTSC